MQRLAFMFFAISVVASTAFIVATAQDLPARVASHFGLYGTADGWMSRGTYVLLFAALASVVPVAVVAGTAIMARIRPGHGCKRNREFWRRPENHPTAIAFCTTRSMIMAGLVAMFLAAMHLMVLRANEVQPSHLPFPAFPLLLGIYVIVVLTISWMFRLQMGRIAREGRRADG